METKEKLAPIRVCKTHDLKEKCLRYIKEFIPTLNTKRNHFGYDSEGLVHFVYCIINLVNSKFYVGKHSTDYDTNKVGYSFYHGTSKHLHNSMVKYGTSKFRMLILRYLRTGQDAYEYETKLITLDMINSDKCYNLQGGGKGFACGKLSTIHKRLEDGTHPFQRRKDGGSISKDKVIKGIHPWLKDDCGNSHSKNLQNRRVSEGRHNLLKRVDGTSIGGDNVKKQIANGTYHLLRRPDGSSSTGDRVKNGTHQGLGLKPWENFCVTVRSQFTWYCAKILYTIYLEFPNYGPWKFMYLCRKISNLEKEYDNKLSPQSVTTMLIKFRAGWVPMRDTSWKKFCSNY